VWTSSDPRRIQKLHEVPEFTINCSRGNGAERPAVSLSSDCDGRTSVVLQEEVVMSRMNGTTHAPRMFESVVCNWYCAITFEHCDGVHNTPSDVLSLAPPA
jgi:hypothetical protein